MLEHTRPNLRILHPLPRVNEIAYDVDENPKAYYFQQAQNVAFTDCPCFHSRGRGQRFLACLYFAVPPKRIHHR